MGGALTDYATISLDDADPIVGTIDALSKYGLHWEWVEPAGSYRRGCESVRDLDFVVLNITEEGRDWLAEHLDQYHGSGVKGSGIYQGVQLDFVFACARSFGAALLYFTGSKDFNIRMRRQAASMGLKLNQYGLYDRHTDERIAGATEREVFEALEMDFVEPKARS